MRNLIRKAGLWFAILILGIAVLDGNQTTKLLFEQEYGGILDAIGIIMVGFGALLWANAMFAAIGLARIRKGFGVIARWSIAVDDWDRFRDFEIEWRKNNPRVIVEQDHLKIAHITSFDIIFGRRQILFGDSYYSLRPLDLVYIYDVSLINGPPPLELLEFRLAYGQSAANADSTTVLHVPVPPGSYDDAIKACKHYQRLIVRLDLPLRHPWRMVRFAILVALTATGLSLVGYYSEFSGAAGRHGDLMMRIGIPLAIGGWGFALAISVNTVLRSLGRGSRHD